MPTVNATLTLPCVSCAHERICARKPLLATLGRFAVGEVPEGVTVRLAVECDAYLTNDVPAITPYTNGATARQDRMVAFTQDRLVDRAVLAATAASEAAGDPAPTEETPKPKRHMSPEGRAAVAEAARKRWADKKVAANQ